jgi:hypothetical protein
MNPELVFLAQPWLLEGLGACRPVGGVQHALGPIPLDAVALNVSQVQRGGLGADRVHA